MTALIDDRALTLHDKFATPQGCKAEVIEGTLRVSRWRDTLSRSKLHTELARLLPPDLAVTNNVTMDMSATGERYVPDLLVTPRDALRGDEWLLPAAEVVLVAEIVSSCTSHQDRVVKLRGYATAGVPSYLLVDPIERAVTSWREPSGSAYQEMHRVSFGTVVGLEPYGKLDTSLFS